MLGQVGEQGGVAERLAGELEAAGLTVLLDDRGGSPGVAFKDAELLGVPTVLVVGKALADGLVELRDRRAGSSRTAARYTSLEVVARILTGPTQGVPTPPPAAVAASSGRSMTRILARLLGRLPIGWLQLTTTGSG